MMIILIHKYALQIDYYDEIIQLKEDYSMGY